MLEVIAVLVAGFLAKLMGPDTLHIDVILMKKKLLYKLQIAVNQVSCYRLIIFRDSLVKLLKFIYFEKATKFCEIFTLLLSYVVPVKSKVEILKIFVAFSEYMNFTMGKKNMDSD